MCGNRPQLLRRRRSGHRCCCRRRGRRLRRGRGRLRRGCREPRRGRRKLRRDCRRLRCDRRRFWRGCCRFRRGRRRLRCGCCRFWCGCRRFWRGCRRFWRGCRRLRCGCRRLRCAVYLGMYPARLGRRDGRRQDPRHLEQKSQCHRDDQDFFQPAHLSLPHVIFLNSRQCDEKPGVAPRFSHSWIWMKRRNAHAPSDCVRQTVRRRSLNIEQRRNAHPVDD